MNDFMLTAPISDRALRVYLLLQLHEDDEHPPTHGELAAMLHLAKPDPIGAAIRELVAFGVLRAQVIPTATGRRTVYELLPAPTAPAVEPEPAYLERRWHGTRTNLGPILRAPVVYWLYDGADRLAYVGSSGHFRERVTGHDDKPWTRFEARECNTRRGARVLEDREIVERRPYLNRYIPGLLLDRSAALGSEQ